MEVFLERMRAARLCRRPAPRPGVPRAAGRCERLPALAAELVRLKVEVIVTQGDPAALAAKDATTTIPIVMVGVADPVGSGLVASLARPGGNMPACPPCPPELVGKQLEFLKDVLPTVSRVAVLRNPANTARPDGAGGGRERPSVGRRAAPRGGAQFNAFDNAFAAMTNAPAGALLLLSDPMFFEHRGRLAELAATSHLPTMYQGRGYVEAGGLISYWASVPDGWRRGATYVDKILKGTKLADLPVEQPTKFELIINLKTAEALGLTIPPHSFPGG